MLHKAWNSKGEMPYCFPRSSIKFQGHTGQNITDFDPNWAFPDYRPVAAFKSLRFALFKVIHQISRSRGTKKSLISTRVERFRTVTHVRLHWRIWNDAQSLMWYRRSALLFLAATKQLHQWYFLFVCPSVCLSVCHTFLTMFPSSYHHEIFRSNYQGPG